MSKSSELTFHFEHKRWARHKSSPRGWWILQDGLATVCREDRGWAAYTKPASTVPCGVFLDMASAVRFAEEANANPA